MKMLVTAGAVIQLLVAGLAQASPLEQYVTEQAALANEQLQAYIPHDPGTDFVVVTSSRSTIVYHFGVPAIPGQIATWAEQTRGKVLPEACTGLQGTGYYDQGLQFRYIYKETGGRDLADFTVNKRACTSYANNNAATCVISKMQGLKNDVAAQAEMQSCFRSYPGGLRDIPIGIARATGKYKSADECTASNTRRLESEAAARNVRAACYRLYGVEPSRVRPYTGPYDPHPGVSDARRACTENTPGPWCDFR